MISNYFKYLVLKRSFSPQIDEKDCGVACLLSIIKYYDGSYNIEYLRTLCGTSESGTSMLGLYKGAKILGFDALGLKRDVISLKSIQAPAILHVTLENNLDHFIVCYKYQKQKKNSYFIVGDPASGIRKIDEEFLNTIWKSRSLLFITPAKEFKTLRKINAEKQGWIFSILKDDLPTLMIVSLLGIIVAGLSLIMAFFSQKLIDVLIPQRIYSKIITQFILVTFLLIFRELLSGVKQYMLNQQSKNFNTRIASFFYYHLIRLPKLFFSTRKVGELTARLNDTSRIQKVIVQVVSTLSSDLLLALVSICFIFTYSIQAGLICLIACPLFYFLLYSHNKSIIDGQRQAMTDFAIAESNYISTLNGIDAIKNFNKQEAFSTHNNKLYGSYQKTIFSLGKIQIRISVLANILSIIFILSILALSTYSVLNGGLKIGELVAIISMSGALFPATANLALMAIPLSEAKIALDRMFEFTFISTEGIDEGRGITDCNEVEITGLSFAYPGSHKLALNEVSTKFYKGEIIGITGENGSGKSTLAQMLIRNYSTYSGVIRVDGQELTDFKTKNWRRVTGVVPQHIHIFNASLLYNIAFDEANSVPDRVTKFLEDFGFDNLLKKFLPSYNIMLGEDGIGLSGGEKQLIGFARTLYQRPRLIILDEATSAMDSKSEKFVLNVLRSMKNEVCTIFITHKIHTLKNFCDRTYIFDKGTIIAHGTHESLISSNNIYSAYWSEFA